MTAMLESAVRAEVAAPRFVASFAGDAAEVLESQRLRYRIFAQELGAQIEGNGEGVDCDQYDPYCKHLLVRDVATQRIVACTRILTDDQAPNAGGFYSASEFDLQMLEALPGRLMEIGRTCVDAKYRNGAVIATLWQGIASFVTANKIDYLFGCASIGLDDGGASAHAILKMIDARYTAPDSHRVRPYFPLPAADSRILEEKPKMPPLLKAYLSLGAKACGDAYWDRDFNCADVFMLLNIGDLHPRYARHFLERTRCERS